MLWPNQMLSNYCILYNILYERILKFILLHDFESHQKRGLLFIKHAQNKCISIQLTNESFKMISKIRCHCNVGLQTFKFNFNIVQTKFRSNVRKKRETEIKIQSIIKTEALKMCVTHTMKMDWNCCTICVALWSYIHRIIKEYEHMKSL